MGEQINPAALVRELTHCPLRALVQADYWHRFWFASISAVSAFIFATISRVFCTTRLEYAISSFRDRAFAGSPSFVFFLGIDLQKKRQSSHPARSGAESLHPKLKRATPQSEQQRKLDRNHRCPPEGSAICENPFICGICGYSSLLISDF